jgi:hypothetical protein
MSATTPAKRIPTRGDQASLRAALKDPNAHRSRFIDKNVSRETLCTILQERDIGARKIAIQ